MRNEFDDGDSASAARTWAQRALVAGLLLGLLIAVGLIVHSFLGKAEVVRPKPQQIAVLRQPPPPPPKPPEKPPEPPKIKEEVKVDTPQPDPKPDEPKPADQPPAADKPLGVDADGSAGSDGFGLAANRGGRDLVGSSVGGGGGGAYYTGLVQRHFFEALSRNRKLLGEEFRVVVRIWIGEDGRVARAEIVNGSGKSALDELVQATLAEMAPLRDVPPSSYRQMQLRLSNRS